MCKTYFVLNYVSRSSYNPSTGKVGRLTNGGSYSIVWYDNLASAQAKADEYARAGNFGIIYESKEFRQIQPVPVIIERTECCDPK